MGNGKFSSREVMQAAVGSMRVGQPAYIKSLDFVSRKTQKRAFQGATDIEKNAMRSVVGALGYLARESRPNLSGPVSILQTRFNRGQVSDIQETNRVVRLAEAHTDRALPVCKIPIEQFFFVSYGDASGGPTRPEQAQAGYVVMIADLALLAGMAAPVTLVSWRSHRVKRVVASASAAEAMGLPEAIAQGDGWSGVVLGLSLCEWREQENVPLLFWVTDSKGNYDHLHDETVGPSEDRRSTVDLAIIREDLRTPRMFLRWVGGKAQVADCTVMVICYELHVVKRSRCWLRPLRSWLPDVKKRRNVNEYRESSHQ